MTVTLVGERLIEGMDPRDLASGVIAERELRNERTSSGYPYEIRRVAVGDVSKPIDRERLNDQLDAAEEILKDHPEWPIPAVENHFQSNPVSEAFYNPDDEQLSLRYWRDNHMPNAEALYPLQRLDDAGRFFPDGFVDAHAMDIFTNDDDSIAIRSRGAIHNALVLEKAASSADQLLIAIALGAGAGVPNIDATVKVRNQFGKRIRWDFYDHRYESLKNAKKLALEAGIPEQDINAERRRDYKKAFNLEDESVDIIDMLGLWEYLPRERCVEAIRELYKKLKPSGMLVVSNMLLDRPHLDFNQRGVVWPGVKPRLVSDLVDIVGEAQGGTDGLRVTLADDRIYAVMEIRKP